MLKRIANIFKKEFSGKSVRAGGYSFISALLVIAIAVFAVGFTSSLPSRITQLDLTSNGLYALSEQSRNIVNSLNSNVEIFHLVQTGYEDNLIVNLLNQYESDKIKVTKKDPVVYPTFASQYTSEQIYNNSLIIVCGTKSRYLSYNELYNVQYAQDGSQSADFNGEALITGAINYVSSDKLPKLYALSGHGSTAIGSNFTDGLKNGNTELSYINLITEQAIPDDANAILIFNPETDITENELTLLKDYLSGGGKLILATGYNDKELPNINTLMSGYGLSYENSLVMEGSANNCIRGYNHYLLPNISTHTVTSPLLESDYSVIMPQAHPIVLSDTIPESVNVTEILKTSADGYTKANAFSMTTAEKEEGDNEGTFTVGVTAENTQTGSKAMWISSVLALTDSANQTVSGANCDLFLNAVNWMCEREEGIAIHAKAITEAPLTVPSGASAMWTLLLIFVIPAATLGIGIYVFVKRRKR